MIDYLRPLVGSFEKHADQAKAPQMAAYMKNKFEFFGIKAPLRKNLIKVFIAEHGLPGPADIESVVSNLYKMRHRELHYAAIEICGKMRRSWDEDIIDLFEMMAVTRSWWDSVDSVNLNCLKFYFPAFPVRTFEITARWIDSGNIWLQRLSVIFQLRFKERTDTRLLERNIKRLAASEEFFVQKGIGWILRDYGYTNPEWVKRFVSEVELKPLSRREALKRLAG